MTELESLCSCKDVYWHGMYEGNAKYQKYRVKYANAHPAKMSMVLCNHILNHLKKLDLIHEDTVIIDFMAGQGTTGIIAELHGYKFIGIELEEHFIDLINGYDCDGTTEYRIIARDENGNSGRIVYGKCGKYNHGKMGSTPHDPHFMPMNRQATAKALYREPSWTIIQGDARRLSELLNTSGAAIVSPPYGDTGLTYKKNGIKIGGKKYERPYMNGTNMGYSAIVSPPYGQMIGQTGGESPQDLKVGIYTSATRKYSDNHENIGNLPDKVGIVSPAYSQAPDRISKGKIAEGYISDAIQRTYDISTQGRTEKQIGNLKDIAGLVSPPYANRMDGGSTREGYSHIKPYDFMGKSDDYRKKWPTQRDSENIGNLMEETNHHDARDTYLSAMLKVYQEAYKSGISPLVVVTKNPTKNHQLRRLDIDTIKLLEMAGYKIIDYHRAILFKTKKQSNLFGETKDVHKGRISFYKRLQLQNGNIPAQWEDVIFAVVE